jgi:uncharacterized protein (TIGR04551 family)
MALAAPVLVCLASSPARAQGTPAASERPSASPPPGPSAEPRPPLVPTSSPPPSPEPPPASSASAPAPAAGGAPSLVNPARDQQELAAQGAQRPTSGEVPANPQDVFSEDWWGRARPVIELHGYFRTRAELFHNFSLGRHNSTVQSNDTANLFPIPIDQSYQAIGSGNGQSINVCGSPNASGSVGGSCSDRTESGANLRLRLDPEIHISDNLRILTEIHLLDNVVLGSTPNAYAMKPAGTATSPTGYQSAGVNGYAPVGFFSTTQGPPTAGVNSWTNSINVQRVWGEYVTPFGQLRFGRMPGHWGLGMVENSGDGVDSDFQTTLDRVMFVTGFKSIDLYVGGAWDFVASGPTNASPYDVYGGQPYNTCNLCNVNEWAAFVAHRTNPETQRLKLARGDLVLNGGLYAVFRSQYIDVAAGSTPQTLDASGAMTSPPNGGLEPRQAWELVPDLWVQVLWRKLRIEAEAATMQGQVAVIGVNSSNPPIDNNANDAVKIRQYGVASQTEFRAVDDKLDLQFGFGWASGDPWTSTLTAPNGLRPELNNGRGPIATFEFHPDYRVDLIFYRHILSRVQGSYYFRPSVDYDFIRHADGERLGGGAAIIWSRASEFVQTPGHARDLGVELNAQLYYQSRDGSLNDDPTKIGGFYTMLQYGVFFPLGGLDYLPGQTAGSSVDSSLSAAQTIRLFLGIIF